MHAHTETFVSSLSPEEVLKCFWALSTEKGSRILSEGSTHIDAQQGLSLRSAGGDIEVSASPRPAGAQVHVVVQPRLGAAQVIDRGKGSEIYQEALACLGR